VSIDEVVEAHGRGKREEVWGHRDRRGDLAGGELAYKGRKKMVINGGKIGPLTQKLYDAIVAIQYGKARTPMAGRSRSERCAGRGPHDDRSVAEFARTGTAFAVAPGPRFDRGRARAARLGAALRGDDVRGDRPAPGGRRSFSS